MRIFCDIKNTLLITTEPAVISSYGTNFASQFGSLLTSISEKDIPHTNAYRMSIGSFWFYSKPYNTIAREFSFEKKYLLSIIATDKMEKHTDHYKRFLFIQKLLAKIPIAHVLYSDPRKKDKFTKIFGTRLKFVNNKSDMVDLYKYHLAIGNVNLENVITERVTDSFLGLSVPICYGFPSLSDIFPNDSFISIDINKQDEAIEKIKKYIYSDEDYGNRLEAVKEAKRIVINKENMFQKIVYIFNQNERLNIKKNQNERLNIKYIFTRRFTRMIFMRDLCEFFAHNFNRLIKKIF